MAKNNPAHDLLDAWSSLLESTVSSDTYAKAMGKYLEGCLALQEIVSQGSSKIMENAPIPSREDLTRLAGQIVALETKIDLIEERLEELARGLDQLIDLVRRTED